MATKFQPRTVLLIPDTHAMPGDSLDRFDRLSDYLDERALTLDKVVHIGDLWDFESLCTHDMNSPHWYHRSLEKDIEAGFYALDKIVSIAHAWGSTDIEFIEGNHEDRYNKWMASDNRLLTSGFPKTVQQLIRTYKSSVKINFHKFLQPANIYGAIFQHYFVSGVMGRPQGGEHHANNLLKSQHSSCICGHSHLLSTATRTKADGSKLHALVGGCFVDPKGEFAYAKAAKKLWWNGVHLLHFYAPGEFDVESISLERLNHL